jgi:hypothetical protein
MSTAGLLDRVDGGWFTAHELQRRVIGPAYNPNLDDAYFMSGGSLGGWFDVIIHRQEVTAPSRLD